MKCPFCEHKDTKVLDSRLIKQGASIRRRRQCLSEECERRFTTYETIEVSLPRILKKDGRREEYNRAKLLSGLEKACQKLPVSPEQINNIIDSVEKKLVELNLSEVSASLIGSIVIMHLKHLNPVAFVRFASVYKEFENIDDFVKDLKFEQNHFTNDFMESSL